jgi:hypothetical protein
VELDLEELQVPRQRRPPKQYNGDAVSHAATTVCYYYRQLYYLLVDTAMQQLDERFHGNSSLITYQALENLLLTEKCGNVSVDLSVYADMGWPDLQVQLELFRRKRSIKCMSDAVDILKNMSTELRGEYREVEKLVRFLLVSPASSEEAERSFSALRRPKSWLRICSPMTQQLLNYLAVSHIH